MRLQVVKTEVPHLWILIKKICCHAREVYTGYLVRGNLIVCVYVESQNFHKNSVILTVTYWIINFLVLIKIRSQAIHGFCVLKFRSVKANVKTLFFRPLPTRQFYHNCYHWYCGFCFLVWEENIKSSVWQKNDGWFVLSFQRSVAHKLLKILRWLISIAI